ncbi:hypothetical protein [Sediminispirochaeta bajacaliforniensis]|uniref:hypothetical protein n=1 Tax=Sediminispirochaeta bajacaliforniensis TaxID=148 RepID=UPI00037A45D6|nr:hypothetical protein [Sediminispirochaeta bajacaliforniensis]
MKHFLAVVFFFAAAALFGQSNEIIDEILAEPQLSPAAAAYLLASLSDGNQAPATMEEALASLSGQFVDVGESISVGEFALLLQENLDLPRGLGSLVYPSPRYALRDLRFLGIIQMKAHPATPLSGEGALRILGRALEKLEVRS